MVTLRVWTLLGMTAPLFGQNSILIAHVGDFGLRNKSGPHYLMTYSDVARCWYKCVADTASEACF